MSGRIMNRIGKAGRRSPSRLSASAALMRPDESANLTAVLWGDAHVSFLLRSRSETTFAAAQDVAAAESAFDALLLVGDVTENGEPGEYEFMADCFDLMRSKIKRFLPATGNHDVRIRPVGVTARRFVSFCRRVGAPAEKGRLYYSTAVNGYAFIVLGTVKSTFEEAALDGAELRWLERELEKAEKGKPIFVLLHQSLKKTHGLPGIWSGPSVSKGDVGPQSDALREILNRYKNVFLLTGHIHAGFGPQNFDRVGNFHSVNVPSVGVTSKFGEYNAPGTGYLMEVFDDRVRFRARDHLKRVDLPEFNKEIILE